MLIDFYTYVINLVNFFNVNYHHVIHNISWMQSSFFFIFFWEAILLVKRFQ